MATNTFYNEVLTDHNIHPAHKHKMENPSYSAAPFPRPVRT